ncbi:hypothetical protein WJX81_005024 [Elliptochloris bilobata]|uniref:Uncharacterized protein n=1 Tax=Elliptochloris bilobata TaxID=381761 RepID=A0AAW1RMS6_9CHLO
MLQSPRSAFIGLRAKCCCAPHGFKDLLRSLWPHGMGAAAHQQWTSQRAASGQRHRALAAVYSQMKVLRSIQEWEYALASAGQLWNVVNTTSALRELSKLEGAEREQLLSSGLLVKIHNKLLSQLRDGELAPRLLEGALRAAEEVDAVPLGRTVEALQDANLAWLAAHSADARATLHYLAFTLRAYSRVKEPLFHETGPRRTLNAASAWLAAADWDRLVKIAGPGHDARSLLSRHAGMILGSWAGAQWRPPLPLPALMRSRAPPTKTAYSRILGRLQLQGRLDALVAAALVELGVERPNSEARKQQGMHLYCIMCELEHLRYMPSRKHAAELGAAAEGHGDSPAAPEQGGRQESKQAE